MTQKDKREVRFLHHLNTTTATIKLSQKGMIYETDFSLFLMFKKGSFMEHPAVVMYHFTDIYIASFPK
jgi:hypothetical protein